MPTRSAFACSVIYLGFIAGAVCHCQPPAAPEAKSPKKDQPARTDRYGDPLPQGAILRLGTLRFCQPLAWRLAFSPDGKFLASAGSDNRIRLWDPDTGKDLRTLEGHTGWINCIALSGDGKWLASGGHEPFVRLWDVASGKERRQFRGHKAPIECLALSPDGKVLASSCLAGTLRLWDATNGKEIHLVPIDRGNRISAMTFSPDSKCVAFNNRTEDGIQLLDVATGKVIRPFKGHTDKVHSLAFTADGAPLFSASYDGTLRAWDVAEGREKRRYGDKKNRVTCVVPASDGKTLIYGTLSEGWIHIRNVADNKDLIPPWKAALWRIKAIAYSSGNKKLALCRDKIAIHDTATGKRINPARESESRVVQLEYSADGKVLAVWREDATIELWNTAKWRTFATLRPKNLRFTSMACSPHGNYVTTAEGYPQKGDIQAMIRRWDLSTGRQLGEFPPQEYWLVELSYSADGGTLACLITGPKMAFLLWDAATGEQRARISADDASGRKPRLSPDGRLLACTTRKNAIALWNTQTGKRLRQFGTPGENYQGLLAFSPDGRTIVAPSGQGHELAIAIQPALTLWETATGQERLHLRQNDGRINAVAFSPDGRLLASGGSSETIHLWDTWTGKEVKRFIGHRGRINSLFFAPDGKTLASGGVDSTILLWDVGGLTPTVERAAKLSAEELVKCWNDLAGTDAARPYRAIAELARHPGQAESLLEEKLAANPQMSAEWLTQLIGDLDIDDFETREKASKKLAALGRLAEGALRKALDGKPSAELKRRVEGLLAKLDGKAEDPEQRRLIRAIEVMERLGTTEARRLLAKLAKEASDANVAHEANASLKRLKKDSADPAKRD